MYALKYDEDTCLKCRTQDCLIKCQYIDIDKESAKKEIRGFFGFARLRYLLCL
jgi:hypothetical protein